MQFLKSLSSLSQRRVLQLRNLLFVLALLPLVRLVAFGFLDRLGANPIEFITRNTGDWALYFLCITLAVTPLRKLTKWNWLVRLRRMLGLYAFFYVALHFTIFFWLDHFFDVQEMWADIVKRPFITIGVLAFVLLIPLAVTSTNAMVRRLGGKRWQWLHRLTYVIVPLGVLHFWWVKAGKNLLAQPILFSVIVGLLLLTRVLSEKNRQRVAQLWSRRSARNAGTTLMKESK
ncbi:MULTISPECIES: protein-methionine-sulfoxide reductase heme-binding subunit MsrQ [unclassified Herbaspirillum]|jgi:sulfoxide reductase heme-binding subunit YedZ|uniref:sulfite oxidase heme-binding subunit YedZ n=1 Tax=unclassified Herbaspirillum TaxID=2624150 RepID=UPI000E2E6AFF|nr:MULTISPECIES: protein-methionine-sulfoxide reductase heme-binding subunit MsrQ [unclassified Herbaspirillum]RFB73675.1 sulfoxide reductase heme-binding subunit YedZ [Herbaspirillum sp. 3R-3a1]TFI10520.1 sulfoxide reductase heme-binding subunit YedZ [Herbaspirillum sp. 3R11]TFI16425.1 sulfoxide reductase heme-binding subunit YedZ [Herbaspirillum sp. 3R-11]TFI26658.1 sulfoxide reductase heme-binding subunit YedZ [Herbaspirillum sp. 3C11]TFI26665.1 sulfoxide reductase heme-binding subunit YedZ